MSYDIELTDPVSGSVLELEAPHHMRGGTYQLGGCASACLNVTYNYSGHIGRVLPGGIRSIYGKTGVQSIPMLKAAIEQLGDDVSDNYWDSTDGNVKRALCQLLALAEMLPHGIWKGD